MNHIILPFRLPDDYFVEDNNIQGEKKTNVGSQIVLGNVTNNVM